MKPFGAFVLLVGLAASHCQCLVPVGEGLEDGGKRDAGSDAGIVAECSVASDCPGSEMTVPACSRQGTIAGFSCIDGRCVWACAGGRSCVTSDEIRRICLACGDARPFCREQCATASGITSLTVEQSTCPQGSDFYMLEWFKLGEGPHCTWKATNAIDGRLLGHIEALDTHQFWADLPSAGGTCVGEAVLTDSANRWIFSCPNCQFVVLAK